MRRWLRTAAGAISAPWLLGLLLATGCMTTRIECGVSSPRDMRLHVPRADGRQDVWLVARSPDGTETRVDPDPDGRFSLHVPAFRFSRHRTGWLSVHEAGPLFEPFLHVVFAGEEQCMLSAAGLKELPVENGVFRLDA